MKLIAKLPGDEMRFPAPQGNGFVRCRATAPGLYVDNGDWAAFLTENQLRHVLRELAWLKKAHV